MTDVQNFHGAQLGSSFFAILVCVVVEVSGEEVGCLVFVRPDEVDLRAFLPCQVMRFQIVLDKAKKNLKSFIAERD
jgi:hypothetical protein